MSERYIVTVEDLYVELKKLIKNGEAKKPVKLSVNYDNCDHIQGLKRIHRNDGFDWITLDGKGIEFYKEENARLSERISDLEELNEIYVDFLVCEGYELADVMKGDVE